MDKPSPPAAAEPSLLRVSFNADASCVSLAGDGGVSVYATESGEALYRYGSISTLSGRSSRPPSLQ